MQRATTHENFCATTSPTWTSEVYATQDEANLDLVNGRLDLVHGRFRRLDGRLPQHRRRRGLRVRRPRLQREPQWHGDGAGIAIRKGEEDLVKAFNDAIAKILADGTYEKINSEYFDFDVYGRPSS